MQSSHSTGQHDESIELLLSRAQIQGRMMLQDQRDLFRAEARMRLGALQRGIILGALALCLGIVALNALSAALIALLVHAGLMAGPASLAVGLIAVVAAIFVARFAIRSAAAAAQTPSPSISTLSTNAKIIKESLT